MNNLPMVRFKGEEKETNVVEVKRMNLYYSDYLVDTGFKENFSKVKGGDLDGFGLLLNSRLKWYLVKDNQGRTVLLAEDVYGGA